MFTAATLIIECLAPIAAFAPLWLGPTRTVLAFSMMAFHCFGIGAVMNLGLFEYVMAVAWLAFLPTWFWDRIAELRSAPSTSCVAPAPGRPEVRTLGSAFAVNAVAALALCLVLSSNVDSLVRNGPTGLGWAAVRYPTRMLGLAQSWRLWSTPMRDRYYVFPACLADGAIVDLHTGETLDWSRPRRRSRNNHWWKYQHLVSSHPHGRKLIAGYGSYLIREWNDANPGRPVLALEMYRLDEKEPQEANAGPESHAQSAEPDRMRRRRLFRHIAPGGGQCAQALRAASTQ
jgi:hypothetical protein